MLDHERLDVYQAAVSFVEIAFRLFDADADVPIGPASSRTQRRERERARARDATPEKGASLPQPQPVPRTRRSTRRWTFTTESITAPVHAMSFAWRGRQGDRGLPRFRGEHAEEVVVVPAGALP